MSEPAPQHCPSPVELDDLELLLSGAVPGVDGFNQPDSPLTLRLPDAVGQQASAAGAVEIVDPEGLPLARVDWPAGTVEPLAHAAFGPFRQLRLTPEQYRAVHAGRTVVPVTDALTESQLHEVAVLGPVALLALVGAGTPALSPVALVRATLAAAALLDDAVVVTVPLASHGDPDTDRVLHWAVLATYVDHDAQPPLVELPTGERDHLPTRGRRDRAMPTSLRPTSRGSSSSSPACPAAASPRWPAPSSTASWSRAGAR